MLGQVLHVQAPTGACRSKWPRIFFPKVDCPEQQVTVRFSKGMNLRKNMMDAEKVTFLAGYGSFHHLECLVS